MGIGMVFIVAEKDAAQTAKLAKGRIIGRIVKGPKGVVLKEKAK